MTKYIVYFVLSLMLLGCSASGFKNDFVKEEKIDINKYEYIGDIIVYKEGYSLLWFIPLSSATPDRAKEMILTLKDEVMKKCPTAVGVHDVQIVKRQGVGLFDWKPSISLWGKIVKAK